MKFRSTVHILFLLTAFLFPWETLAAWVQKASFGGQARHRCTGFSIGNKGYIGGGHTNSGTIAYFADYWEYDPATNCWTQIADFGGGERYHSTAFSIGNFGYVGLGENNSGQYTNDFWKYIPLINTWVQIAPLPGEERRGACGFMIDGKGYVGTGQTQTGYANDFYSFDPLANEWTVIDSFPGPGRSSAVAFAYDGKGYLGTGHMTGDDLNDFYEYDPGTDTWTQKSDVGPMPRQDATGFVLNGEGYIGTGNNVEGTDNFSDFWKYNFETDTWTEIAGFDGQARCYMVSFTIGNTAYCGTGTNGTNLRDFWAFYPLLETSELLPDDQVHVYPNPTQQVLFIDAGFITEPTLFRITDLSGKIIFQTTLDQTTHSVDLGETGSGYYIYSLISATANMSGKIQIIR